MHLAVTAIREELMARDDSFRQLVSRHSELESQLQQFKERRFLSADEEMQELRLKKLKLQIKDEMEQMVRQWYSDHHQHAS
jgi:uncharacterized protein YdcH (DUF465 family)